jgi:hypothetical protein
VIAASILGAALRDNAIDRDVVALERQPMW